MNDYLNWFEDRINPRSQAVVGRIKKQRIYEALSSAIVQKIEDDLPANEIINWIKEQTRQAHLEKYGSQLEVGALNNVAGDWNEFMVTTAFSEIAIDINNANQESTVVVFPLPNSQISPVGSNQLSSKFLSLFKQSAFNLGGELAKKLAQTLPYLNG